MAKAYWIAFYHSISDPEAMKKYAELARPAVESGGGRFMARGMPTKVYEAGMEQRVVMEKRSTSRRDGPERKPRKRPPGDGSGTPRTSSGS